LTVFLALRCFKSRQNQHNDTRRDNGRSVRRKITAEIEEFLLWQDTLQAWSGQTIEQRVAYLKEKFGISIYCSTLLRFYYRHQINYGVSSYQYVQAMSDENYHVVRMFAVKLAKMID
jgi:hypothetical protein